MSSLNDENADPWGHASASKHAQSKPIRSPIKSLDVLKDKANTLQMSTIGIKVLLLLE